MANDFSQEEIVAFEDLMEGFNDNEIMSKNVNKYNVPGQTMARTGDTFWRPQPYIMNSFDGMDQTGNFNDKTQLSVPISIGYEKSAPWTMDAKELRDALQENRLGEAARQKISSDINNAVLDIASTRGTIVVPIAADASGFDDVAEIDATMNELGIPAEDRILALSSRDYNGMAGNLANRDYFSDKVKKAYERAYVGQIASFDTWKLDYSKRIAAAGGPAATIDTTSASTFYTPLGVTSSPTTTERLNVDNRYQTVTVSSTTGVVAGDAFTIADVYSVHHITKEATDQLKTFRVISVDSGTTMTISPPIIDPDEGAGAESEIQYQNVDTTATSATAAITWLNTDAARINPFFRKQAIELIPARYELPMGAGMSVMRATTDSGIEISFSKFIDINTYKTKFRVDAFFGVGCVAPEQAGILIFGQTS